MKFRVLLLPALLLSHLAAANPPDMQVVEFFNSSLGHYFVTADASEAAGIDGGRAGPGWVRTGRTFGAWLNAASAPAGSTAVCRFYSSAATSHFFTANAVECTSLRALEATQRRLDAVAGRAFVGWAFEANAFTVLAPAGANVGAIDGGKAASTACPTDTVEMLRAYNDGFANGQGANHRFVDDSGLRDLMVSRGWTNEGVAFCAPVKAAAVALSIPVTPAAGSFPELAAAWSGPGEWEFKTLPAGAETEIKATLKLTIDNAGVVNGSGNGCTLAGAIASADAVRAFYRGTIEASACTDTRFNGTGTLSIERPTSGPLQVHFSRRNTAAQVEVEAALSRSTTGTTPSGGNGNGNGNGSGNGNGNGNGSGSGSGNNSNGGSATPTFVLAGTWVSDTVQWTSTIRSSGGAPEQTVSGAHSMSLTISSTNGVTGSGFGCSFTGSITQPVADKTEFVATLVAAGCQGPGFNGSYANASIKVENNSAIELQIERETETKDVKSKVKIEGVLRK